MCAHWLCKQFEVSIYIFFVLKCTLIYEEFIDSLSVF